ncbi:MAG: hypothetical protein LCH77_01090 [Actinobacteria bacterium]|nr:hypothetical protein [Actinomycetota bacterium]
MMISRRLIRTTGAATALAAAFLVPGATAASAATERTTVTWVDYDHDTRHVPAGGIYCDFPIERVRDGRLWTRTFYDSEGRVTRTQAWVSNYTYTLRNPANGKELTSHLGGTATTWYDADGTVRFVINGNDVTFTSPGQGRITGYVGRYVEVYSPDGGFEVAAQTHNFADSIFPATCAALS